MQDVAAAADELERCVKDLKSCGALIVANQRPVALSDKVRADVASHNAERLLGVHVN